jgi:pimeloyl-ACP methyl ester carboxylesterase
MSDSRVTVLPDGRELGWLEIGKPKGAPIFAFHGTPGSRSQFALDEASVGKAGQRLICPDRPGYGLSTFQPGRRLIDWPRDVEYLADHLKIERFAVLGHSGGGPHAVVCAALLSSRVTGAAIVSGVGPFSHPQALESMKRSDQMIMKLALRQPRVLRAFSTLQMGFFRHWPDRALDFMMKPLPEQDVAILARPQVRASMAMEAQRLSRTAGTSVAQDFEVFAADWGFDLGAIEVPVHLWQGDADVNVPPLHARLMHDAIPGSVLHELPGAGHFFIFDRLTEICEDLKVS